MKKPTITKEPEVAKPITGNSRVFSDGKLHMPTPIIEPVKKPTVTDEDLVPDDDLPPDLKAAFELQKTVNELAPSTRGKARRLQRITRHVAQLQRSTPPPTLSYSQLRTVLLGAPATDGEVAAARASLITA